MSRIISESIELDQSLRKSRAAYVALAVIFLPGAFFGITYLAYGIPELFVTSELEPEFGKGWIVMWIVIGLVLIGAEYSAISSAREASRRLKILRDDPTKRIQPMPVGFLSTFFR